MNRLQIFILTIAMFFSLASAAQYKPGNTITWKKAGELPAADDRSPSLGFAGPVAGVLDHILLIAGGSNFPDSMPWHGGKKKYYDEVYLFEKTGDSLILKNRSFRLPQPIAYAGVCTLPGGILYAGGENDDGASKKVWLLQFAAKSAELRSKALPDLPVALTNACICYCNNTVFIAGGENANGASNALYYLDLGKIDAGWKSMTALPHAVTHSLLVGDGARLYLVGGRRKDQHGISELFADVYAFDCSKKTWTQKQSLPYPVSAHCGALAGTSHILLIGGDKGERLKRSETITVAIAQEKDETKRKQLIEQKIEWQSSHPGFSHDVLVYDLAKDTWTRSGEIPFEVPVTTTAVVWDNQIIIPGGEIKAGVRTPVILMGTIDKKRT